MSDTLAHERLSRAAHRHRLLAPLARRARDSAWAVFVVGGWVRDTLLGRRARDLDLVAGAGANGLLAWLAARSSHRAVTFEQRVVNHRLTIRGTTVDVVEQGDRTLEDELARRDYGVNAIAWDLVGERLIDPCGGLVELGEGRLDPPRCNAFRDDPLRMLRGVRLDTEIPGLRLGDRALALTREGAAAIRSAAPERVLEELDRILLSPRAAAGIRAAQDLGLLESWLPELGTLKGVLQNRCHHEDVWEHTLLALELAAHPARLGRGLVGRGWPRVAPDDLAPDRPAPELALTVLRWSLLLHDLGKPETRVEAEDGQASFHGHDLAGERIAGTIAARLGMPRRRSAAIGLIVRHHLRLVVPPQGELSARALARIVRAAGPWTEVLALHSLADQGASRGVGWRRVRTLLRRTVARLLEKERAMTAAARRGRLVNGRDVMDALDVDAGPEIGRVLREVEQLRDDGILVTRADALRWLTGHGRSRKGGKRG